MNLTLTTEEREVVAWAVQGVVSDLGAEIADTENQELREDLKARKRILMSILARLH